MVAKHNALLAAESRLTDDSCIGTRSDSGTLRDFRTPYCGSHFSGPFTYTERNNFTIKCAPPGATLDDIVENPKRLTFHEIEGPQLIHSLQDVDLAVVWPSYFVNAGRPEQASQVLLTLGLREDVLERVLYDNARPHSAARYETGLNLNWTG